MNEQTPRAERLHIAFYGRCNSGKSSLINALTGQQSAVVSATPGTTTDPVLKTMEIHGLGPCVLIDTPGFDDEGDLGILRVQQSRKMLEKTDLAVLLLSEAVPQNDEIEWFRLLEERHIPTVVVRSKADLVAGMPDAEAEALFGQRPLRVSASNSTGLDALREALIRNLPEDYNQPEITGSLASAGDVVMLVMPQDIQAPKGRLILPQVQTIRELLDKKCRVVCCTTDQIEGTLSSLAAPPKLIITDSQVFSTVYAQKPAASLLTSFSVLFARYKGDIDYFVESAAAIGQLREDSRVLIAEACTHAPVGEDIGRVKIPAMLRKRIGPALRVNVVAGTDFPADLTPYDLVIHCGACMFNRRPALSRAAPDRPRRGEAPGVEGFCQPFEDGPLNNPDNPVEAVYLQLIASAKRMLYITTPYYAVEESIQEALCIAADAGVDVRLMIPAIPDKKLVYLVAETYWGELLRHGVKIYKYTPGFVHAKSVMADREAALIGSTNMDYRSFQLHYEDAVMLYHMPVIEELLEDMDHIVEDSQLYTLEDWENRPWLRRMTASILKLGAIWL